MIPKQPKAGWKILMAAVGRLLVAGITVVTSMAASERSLDEVRGSKPNIIFVMVDDMGYGDLGVYGQKKIMTPNIDRMAREGIRYTDVYTGHAVCAPSRDALMTGRHTGHTTVRGNTGRRGGVVGLGRGGRRVPLHEWDVTVAEVLQEAGYATGMVGKWGLGEPKT